MAPCRICGAATRRVGPVRGDYSAPRLRGASLRCMRFRLHRRSMDGLRAHLRRSLLRRPGGRSAGRLPVRTGRARPDDPPVRVARSHAVGRAPAGRARTACAGSTSAAATEASSATSTSGPALAPADSRRDRSRLRRASSAFRSCRATRWPTQAASFDVVTAIEVIEHTIDPLAELRTIRKLLRSGGLLFLTTGNAEPFASRLLRWPYIVPEIHVSFFEPRTLEYAFASARSGPDRLGSRRLRRDSQVQGAEEPQASAGETV